MAACGDAIGRTMLAPWAEASGEAIAAAAVVLRNRLPASALRFAFPHPAFGEALAAAVSP